MRSFLTSINRLRLGITTKFFLAFSIVIMSVAIVTLFLSHGEIQEQLNRTVEVRIEEAALDNTNAYFRMMLGVENHLQQVTHAIEIDAMRKLAVQDISPAVRRENMTGYGRVMAERFNQISMTNPAYMGFFYYDLISEREVVSVIREDLIEQEGWLPLQTRHSDDRAMLYQSWPDHHWLADPALVGDIVVQGHNRVYFSHIMDAKDIITGRAELRANKEKFRFVRNPVMLAGYPVMANGVQVGVVGILHSIRQQLAQMDTHDIAIHTLFIMDERGVLASNNAVAEQGWKHLLPTIYSRIFNEQDTFTLRGGEPIVAGKNDVVMPDDMMVHVANLNRGSVQQDRHGPYLLVGFDQDVLLQPIRLTEAHIFNIFVIAVLVSLVMAIVMSHKVGRPLLILTKAMERYALGDNNFSVATEKRGDELGRLSRAIVHLVKRFEAAGQRVAEREARLVAIMDNAADGILIVDNAGLIRAINPAALVILEPGVDNPIGGPVHAILPEHYAELMLQVMAREPDDERGHSRKMVSMTKLRRNGHLMQAEMAISRFVVEGEVMVAAIMHDITHLKETEKELQLARMELEDRVAKRTSELRDVNGELEERISELENAREQLHTFQQIFHYTTEAIVVTDADYTILHVNDAYADVTGFSQEASMGLNVNWRDTIPNARMQQEYDQSIEQSGYWVGESHAKRANGEPYTRWISVGSMKNAAGDIERFFAIFSDISDRKETEQQLEKLAFWDQLTGLPNRLLFRDRLERAFIAADRHGSKVGCLFIDLDRFKVVNDTLGHWAGDLLLQTVSKRLQHTLRRSDTITIGLDGPNQSPMHVTHDGHDEDMIARLGGDEFTIILTDLAESKDAGLVAHKIIESLNEPVEIDGTDFFVGASVGIAIYPDDGTDYDRLTRNADSAMYQAKEKGRGIYQFFTAELNDKAERRHLLEVALRQAVSEDQLFLVYQPKIDMGTGYISGMEALLRWRHPELGLVSPAEFIPLAEDSGLIVPIGEWVLREACRQNMEWREQGIMDLRVAVNLSQPQFERDQMSTLVAEVLAESGLPPQWLELEITERVVLDNLDRVIAELEKLKDQGVHVSMDDFGTGYSSMSYLKMLPLDTIKIDQSFVRHMARGSDDEAIVTAIISMAHALGLSVVAEGVETPDQAQSLMAKGCFLMQGYYFAKPFEADDFANFVTDAENFREDEAIMALA